MKRILTVLLVAMLSLTVLPALAQDDAENTIVDIAAGNENFSTLVAAVDAAGLTDTLDSGEFTVFAPRNGAFETRFAETSMTAEELLEDTETLTSILTYHVVPGTVTSENIATMASESENGIVELETVNGATLSLSIDTEQSLVVINDGEATVSDADIAASNGVIHVIDNVLMPPADADMEDMDGEEMEATEESMDEMDEEAMEMVDTSIVDIASETQDLSTLVAAVEAADLTETLSSGEYTVFAPRNGAFETLITEMDTTADDLLADIPLLTDVLTYHVVEGVVTFEDLTNLAAERNDGLVEVETVNGATLRLSVDVEESTVDINDGEATVSDADITADNGIIHIIDNVLLPPMDEDSEEMDSESMDEEDMDSEEMSAGTIADVAANNENFSILVAALDTADLVGTLSEGEYTVFAPTNEAFANLLSTTGLTQDELLESELLSDILLYHVVEGTVLAEDVVGLDGEAVETVSGAQVGIAVSEDGTVTLNDTAVVTQTDIEASNGVIHVIDEVLLPQAALDALGL